jgi:hypothetical protein
MIRSMAGLTVRVTINTLFYEGSGRRAELTPLTIPIPTITMTPTVIQRGGICAKCAPNAKPTIRMQNPTIYKPKDIRHPSGIKHVAGRLRVARRVLRHSEATGEKNHRPAGRVAS